MAIRAPLLDAAAWDRMDRALGDDGPGPTGEPQHHKYPTEGGWRQVGDEKQKTWVSYVQAKALYDAGALWNDCLKNSFPPHGTGGRHGTTAEALQWLKEQL